MLRSMTGYGRGENTNDNRRFIVEIKGVNHKYNDVTIKLPRSMSAIEDRIRKEMGKTVFRGKIDVYISSESFAPNDVLVKVNEPLADAYYNAIRTLENRYGLTDGISMEMLSRFPDILTVERAPNDDSVILQSLLPALNTATEMFVEMREREGAALAADINNKLDRMSAFSLKISERAPLVANEYHERLTARITEILADAEIDESRILTEAALFADRSCIDEELTRLNSHISQMRGVLTGSEHSIGRKLDFIVQEMNREVNTISSKANDLEITNITILLKSEVEKVREQIQNIE